MLPGHIFIFVLSLEQGSWEGAKQTIKSFRIKGTDGNRGIGEKSGRKLRSELEGRQELNFGVVLRD